jgi:hypothetical protein
MKMLLGLELELVLDPELELELELEPLVVTGELANELLMVPINDSRAAQNRWSRAARRLGRREAPLS